MISNDIFYLFVFCSIGYFLWMKIVNGMSKVGKREGYLKERYAYICFPLLFVILLCIINYVVVMYLYFMLDVCI